MRAVVFLGEGKLEIREYPDPVPGPDEVVIRMKASGMCGSDLHHLHGPQRTGSELVIEGHEPCGVVELVGDAVRPSEAKVGDRVMVHHYDGCRTCQYCRSGWTQYCPNARTVYGGLDGDGGHADFMKIPAHTLIRLPDSLSFKTGAAISCGTGTAFAAIKRVGLSADETVAVFGQGPVGPELHHAGQGLRRSGHRRRRRALAAGDGQTVRRRPRRQRGESRTRWPLCVT